jgi:hypothetical protein
MFQTRPMKVCLVRDPSLSRFDPIEIALKALAEVQCLESLPKDPMALRPDAIVVVSRSLDSFSPSQQDLERATARASGGSPLPLLWITAGSITRGGSNALAPIPAPVRLVDLAAFVDNLETAEGVSDGMATSPGRLGST